MDWAGIWVLGDSGLLDLISLDLIERLLNTKDTERVVFSVIQTSNEDVVLMIDYFVDAQDLSTLCKYLD